MFKITWDKANNGVLLALNANGDTLTVSPRPVFFEELDLLGFDDKAGWKYPKSKEPLLWACDRRYYYKGKLVAEVKGGNIFDNAELIVPIEFYGLELKSIDIKKVIASNKQNLFLIEHEALQFINETYRTYSLKKIRAKAKVNSEVDWGLLAENQEKKTKTKYAVVKEDCDSFDMMPLNLATEQNKTVYLNTKIEQFIVSFSGGKDSQVVLDLVSRVLPPDDFLVIYSDTGLEIPPSLKLYKEIETLYQKRYPNLKFHLAKNPQDTVELWDKFGLPSRVHRWCCSVTKTAPLYRYLKELNNIGKQPNVLTFEGIRAEESSSREKYDRKIGKNVKHSGVINASPIFYWNVTEVFLYLFSKKIPINEGYRYGLTRVGCCICPYSSEWSERIVNKVYSQSLNPYLNVIKKQVINSGVKDVDEYIKTGKWKIRAGGKSLISTKSRIDIIEQKTDLIVLLINPQENLLEWLKIIGKVSYKIENNIIYGEIFTKDVTCIFKIEPIEEKPSCKIKVIFSNIYNFPILLGKIKKVLNKTTYCTHCISCEIECPTGALTVEPKVKVDISKCIHCSKCIDFIDKGCVMAKSLNTTEGVLNMAKKQGSINRYEGFGIKEEWLDAFFRCTDTFLETEHGLGGPQVRAFTNWLKDGELIDNTITSITELCIILKYIYPTNPNLVWEILWINFVSNSIIINWYIQKIPLQSKFKRTEIDALLIDSYLEMQSRTLTNAVDSLAYLFKYSKIENIKVGKNEKIGKDTIISRFPNDNVNPLSVAYSLYRYAKENDRYNFTVSELYDEKETRGIYKEFGLSKERFENILRGLQENKYKIVQVDLQMGLDNISLREDLTPLSVLKLLLEK
ncbi:MAG: phosphoadenosine phosphosulfate reductase family protein [Bacteroidales bacterium]|jgi:3'-phosphoadenosine 5'-phosphosulfate sulfotransferase (PAPS reductase)/FAD synthetase/ferredoxin|nr:phosphoadenosine phosphosulfate reductase family protein [Bacteroidales bacterium]